MNKNLWLTGIILLVASGCTMIPRYTRPAAPVPAAWPTGGTNQPAAGAPWRDFYVDANLRNIIGLALTNNRDLRVASLTIEKTRAAYRLQRADLLPTINAVGYGTKQDVFANVSSFEEKVQLEYYSASLGFSAYELDFFGRIRSLKARALERYLATEQARRSAQISLMAELAGVYLNLGANRERLRLAQDTLAAQEATYEMIRQRVQAGESSELDLHQAQTRLEAARVDIAKYTGQLALDKNALDLLAGAPVPAAWLPAELGTLIAIRDISAGLPSEVLQRRPDILQAEHQLKAANANIGAARAAFFPSVMLSTSYGTMDDQLGGLFKPGSWIWSFTPQITMPIFDTGRNLANLDAAKSDRAIALAQYEQAIQAAFREVADALIQRSSLLDQLEAQESLEEASLASYGLADARYRSGIDNYLTVLDAQRSLYGAQQGLIAIRLARLTNLVTLYKVLGGG